MDLKIRIFALAKELGMDSKILIEHCNAAGIQIKNSALASISPEEKDRVLKHMESAKNQGSTATASAPVAPSRDPVRDAGTKMRSIKPMTPRPQSPQNGKGKRVDEELEVVEADPVVRGQTASSSYKPGKLENGRRVMIPPHIGPGTRIVVSTADGSYLERAKD